MLVLVEGLRASGLGEGLYLSMGLPAQGSWVQGGLLEDVSLGRFLSQDMRLPLLLSSVVSARLVYSGWTTRWLLSSRCLIGESPWSMWFLVFTTYRRCSEANFHNLMQ